MEDGSVRTIFRSAEIPQDDFQTFCSFAASVRRSREDFKKAALKQFPNETVDEAIFKVFKDLTADGSINSLEFE
jgi:hypothetical protein